MKWIIPFAILLALISCSPEDDIQPTPNPTGPTGSIYDSLVGFQFYSSLDTCYNSSSWDWTVRFISKDSAIIEYSFAQKQGEWDLIKYESGRYEVFFTKGTSTGDPIIFIESFDDQGNIYGRRSIPFKCDEFFTRSPL